MVNGIFTIPLFGQDPGSGAAPNATAGEFNAFVGGPENLLTGHAIRSCLKRASAGVSPLVLYGPRGSGKSHLARGLAAYWQKHLPSCRVMCMGGSEFSQSYLDAVAVDRLGDWRRQVCGADLLIIDDLGQLAGKHAAQQELRHALDAVASREALAVVTARGLPNHSRMLLASLRSRLSAGLAVPVTLPAAATRRYLLERLAAARGISLSGRAAQNLADGLHVGVAGLAAAVLDLDAIARSKGQRIGMSRARHFVAERGAASTPDLREIARLTAKYLGLRLSDLKGPLRRRSLVAGRSLAMFLARQLTGHSLEQIGAYFGGRDHTTVLHACRRTEKLLRRDRAMSQTVADLKSALVAP